MQHLIDHARSFPRWATQQQSLFSGLADGQSPLALFITCGVAAYSATTCLRMVAPRC